MRKRKASEITYSNITPGKEEYYRLYQSTGWNDEYKLSCEELYRSMLHSYCVVSAYDNDILAGLGRVISDGIVHALIVDLIVLPEYQGRGIGSNILKLLKEKCLADGIRDIQLFSPEGRLLFFEKNGFSSRPVGAPGMQLKRI